MDERIDLTQNRDFRDQNITNNRLFQMTEINLNFEFEDVRKEIDLDGDRLLINNYPEDRYSCYRCGAKTFNGMYNLCDKCNTEMSYNEPLFRKEIIRSLF